MKSEMKLEDYSQKWFSFALEGHDGLKPIHTALYLFLIFRYLGSKKSMIMTLNKDIITYATGIKNKKDLLNALELLSAYQFLDYENTDVRSVKIRIK